MAQVTFAETGVVPDVYETNAVQDEPEMPELLASVYFRFTLVGLPDVLKLCDT